MGFVLNTTYYTGNVYEWNLPAGITCPFAGDCKVLVNRVTGKFIIPKGKWKCYAGYAERYPAVRNNRFGNLRFLKDGGKPELPADCENVRIHASGDFFSQSYFDVWLQIAKENPNIKFWAFTKSIKYWLSRKDSIPSNLILTASYGGLDDSLIEPNRLKSAKVFLRLTDVPADLPIDINDDYARKPDVSFALLDNKTYSFDLNMSEEKMTWRKLKR